MRLIVSGKRTSEFSDQSFIDILPPNVKTLQATHDHHAAGKTLSEQNSTTTYVTFYTTTHNQSQTIGDEPNGKNPDVTYKMYWARGQSFASFSFLVQKVRTIYTNVLHRHSINTHKTTHPRQRADAVSPADLLARSPLT
jgi:hypothetical protein